METLKAIFEKHVATNKSCKIQGIVDSLSQDDATTLTNALADEHSFPSVTIANVMKEIGHPVSDTAVRRHRRKQCRCTERA
jgi:hypothetical protein